QFSHKICLFLKITMNGVSSAAAVPSSESTGWDHQEWRLSGGRDACAGRVEVFFRGTWSTVCNSTWYDTEAAVLCRSLGCGDVLQRLAFPHTLPGKMTYMCGSLQPSYQSPGGHQFPGDTNILGAPVPLACDNPAKVSPPPPHTLTPLHRSDPCFSMGLISLYPRICSLFSHGSDPAVPMDLLPLPVDFTLPHGSAPLPVDPTPLPVDVLSLPDSQPRALRRLAAGPTPCEGDIQVFHEGQWWDLCESRAAQRDRHGRQICRELGCGNLTSSTEIREPPSTGVTCGLEPLHLCQPKPGNSRSCQDSKPLPTGTSAGTVVSICLALLLFLILSLICGPPAYRKLMKRSRGQLWDPHPSFLPSPAPPSPRAGDNDYAQPPKRTSQLSAYPALEAACRRSNPPDNSSDSDYDLHSARRV
uniref:SRCR domain-containing protein n=1 Tax=Zonotrichia albicollis TaxID=44394 RepID=A0A8D2MB35_ZONAL